MQDASSQLTAPQPQQLRDVQASLFHQDMMTADLLQALHGLGPSKVPSELSDPVKEADDGSAAALVRRINRRLNMNDLLTRQVAEEIAGLTRTHAGGPSTSKLVDGDVSRHALLGTLSNRHTLGEAVRLADQNPSASATFALMRNVQSGTTRQNEALAGVALAVEDISSEVQRSGESSTFGDDFESDKKGKRSRWAQYLLCCCKLPILPALAICWLVVHLARKADPKSSYNVQVPRSKL